MKRKHSAESAHHYGKRDGMFLLVVIGSAWAMSLFWPVPKWLISLYLATSVLSFAAYALDKLAAVWGMFRVPEIVLHVLALCGGWPGALMAQQLLRHKTVKKEFRQVFWLTVMINIAALIAVVLILIETNAPI